ncbi:unnamed protein product, partial [Effrenium voratum]
VDKNGDISTDELQMKVLPYIAEHFESITNAREEDQFCWPGSHNGTASNLEHEKRRAAKLRSDARPSSDKLRARKRIHEFLLMRLDAATSTSCASSSAKWQL